MYPGDRPSEKGQGANRRRFALHISRGTVAVERAKETTSGRISGLHYRGIESTSMSHRGLYFLPAGDTDEDGAMPRANEILERASELL